MTAIRAVAFDVIETLVSLDGLREPLAGAGLTRDSAEAWLTATLRDAFAFEIAGAYQPFRTVAAQSLTLLAARQGKVISPAATESVVAAFSDLDAQSDAAPALATLCDAGMRCVTLTNGSEQVTAALLSRNRLDAYIERTVSIDEVGHWKPHPDVYRHCARLMNVEPQEVALVAAHPWDVHGAMSAGLRAGFVHRSLAPLPASVAQADAIGVSLVEIVDTLLVASRDAHPPDRDMEAP